MFKKIFILLIATVSIVILIVFGFQAFVKHIYNRNDCKRFNIDNIELRTGINVPYVLNYQCNSNEKIKKASFTIDTLKVDIKNYIKKNKFKQKDSLYKRQGENKNTKWKATLHPKNALLSFTIEYKNK